MIDQISTPKPEPRREEPLPPMPSRVIEVDPVSWLVPKPTKPQVNACPVCCVSMKRTAFSKTADFKKGMRDVGILLCKNADCSGVGGMKSCL
jgi:hypothetical protein